MRRRLLLIGLDWAKRKDPPFSLASASIGANLIKHGIPVVLKTWRINNDNFNNHSVISFVESHDDGSTDVAFGGYV